LSHQGATHEQAADAGALAADRAMAELGVRLNPVGYDRQGWRGRLANVERLLSTWSDNPVTITSGEGGKPECRPATEIIEALDAIREMIDEVGT
jgi:hypothetical protein